jgi:hypothetical protein
MHSKWTKVGRDHHFHLLYWMVSLVELTLYTFHFNDSSKVISEVKNIKAISNQKGHIAEKVKVKMPCWKQDTM